MRGPAGDLTWSLSGSHAETKDRAPAKKMLLSWEPSVREGSLARVSESSKLKESPNRDTLNGSKTTPSCDVHFESTVPRLHDALSEVCRDGLTARSLVD